MLLKTAGDVQHLSLPIQPFQTSYGLFANLDITWKIKFITSFMHRVYTEIALFSQSYGMLLPQVMDFHSVGQHFDQCIAKESRTYPRFSSCFHSLCQSRQFV